jgi:hypothetical protein
METHSEHEQGARHPVLQEFLKHAPYTAFSAVAGMGLLALLTYANRLENLQNAFHVFHPTHLFLSATATTAMFWLYEKKLIKAIIIGLLGSVGVCGVSDIGLPYLGGLLLKQDMHLHICFFEEPFMMPFVIVGIFVGLVAADKVKNSTVYSHSAHVVVSSMATLLYMVSFGMNNWLWHSGELLVIIILSVMIPCCFSDIIFPLLFVKRGKDGKNVKPPCSCCNH